MMKVFIPLLGIFMGYYPRCWSYQAWVQKIFDGDTVEIQTIDGKSKRVRLLYIDAPELAQGKIGIRAKNYLEDKILGKKLIVCHCGKGYYGRVLAELYLGEEDINLSLLKSKLAWPYPWSIFQNQKQKKLYLQYGAHQGLKGLKKAWVFRRIQRRKKR